MSTLGEEFPKQQARVRELLVAYKEIGPAGNFGALMLEDLLRRADRAVMEGDTVAMLGIYKEMEQSQ